MALVTDEYLAAYLPSGRNAASLVKVELTDPSAVTLYLSSREVVTPGSPPRVWQAALDDIGPVVEPGDLGAFDPGLATFDFRVTARPLGSQSASDSGLDLFASHYWYGATVTLYSWELGMADFSKAAQWFKGVVIEYETEDNRVHVYCQQRNGWITRVPADEVTRQKYPRAPEKSIGLAVPICYGSLLTPPARSPASAQGAYNQTLTGLVGLRRAGVRGVAVSLGKGDGVKGRVLFAGHACKTFNDDAAGSTPAVPHGNVLCEIDPTGGDVFNGSGGTGFDFNDVTTSDADPFDVFFPVMALDSKQVASNPGDNARAGVDPFNDTSYALLDYDAGQRELRYVLGDFPAQGLWRATRLVVMWSTTAGATAVRADFVSDTGGITSTLAATADLNTPTGAGAIITSGMPADKWNLGSGGAYIKVYLTGVATGQKARIFAVGLSYRFRPQWPVATPSRTYLSSYRTVQKKKGLFFNPFNAGDMFQTVPVYTTEPEEQIVDGQFFATLEGYADDGSGTYTGTASALIQRPPDVLRHFLATYCSETLLETGSNPGSLVTLRDDLKTWRGSDIVAAFSVDDFTQSSDVVRNLSRSTLAWFFISCYTDKWSGVAWKAGRSVDFPRRLTRYDLSGESSMAGPKVIMHRDDVQNDLMVKFGLDAWTRRFVHETTLGPGRSIAGHAFRNLRDEHMTVVASQSDRLDFHDGGSRTASLTAAAYTPAGLAAHVQTQMRAVMGGGVQIYCGHAFTVNASGIFDFDDGVPRVATLTAGTYTGETLAAHLKTQMDAVSTGTYTVTYSRSTHKFTISRGAGTFSLPGASSTDVRYLFGFTPDSHGAASSITSDFAIEEERFVITSTATLKLLWETGSNGIDAATPRACGGLLGFDMARDWDDGSKWAVGHSPKNDREQDMTASVARYGSRPPLNVELDYVNDTDTAREVRNRLADLWGEVPVEIQFETERMPDLQRGMVFDFDASLDEVKPYTVPGTDGSWAGKKFVAVRVERHSLPTSHQAVVAFEVPAA